MNTMKATTTKTMTTTASTRPVEIDPCRPSSNNCTTACGSRATMPANMMSDDPLPTPRDVICSPSQTRNIVPPVSVTMVEIRNKRPGSLTMPARPSSPIEMP